MQIVAGDYRLLVARPCRRAYVTAWRDLHRLGLHDLFRSGLDRIVGEFSLGKQPLGVRKTGETGVYAATVQNVRMHLLVDGRRTEIRIIRVFQLSLLEPA